MIKKADVLLAVAIIAVFGILIAAFFIFGPSAECAVIKQDGVIIARMPLDTDASHTVTHDTYGFNVIEVKGGKVSVSYADCRDKICVDHKPISQEGEIIVCLPHRLTVEVGE